MKQENIDVLPPLKKKNVLYFPLHTLLNFNKTSNACFIITATITWLLKS